MLAPFESNGNENPYTIHSDLQECMQNLVGIIRVESELNQALEIIQKLKQRAKNCRVEGNRHYNPGWHLALDLHSLSDLRRSGDLGGDRAQREPRRPYARRLSQHRSRNSPKSTSSSRMRNGEHDAGPGTAAGNARRTESTARGEKVMADQQVHMRVWRGDASGRRLQRLPAARSVKARSCSTSSTRFRRSKPTIWRCAGTAKPANAARAAPRVNGKPRLMCMTRMNTFRAR